MGLRLNLGSGQRPFSKPWINVDCQERWSPDLQADISKFPWIFADESAEVICLHHVLEHFGLTEGADILRECWRVLKPGGRLLIFVPDQVALAKAFLDNRITDYIYTVNLMGAYMGDDADRHKWLYCYRSLYKALLDVGRWSTVSLFDWRNIPGADIAKDWWILGVEAIK